MAVIIAPSLGTEAAGVLVVDKPSGPTSFRIVAEARKLFGTRRIGHCGTLDPMASGVLLLVVGEATKLSGALTGADKSYFASINFGTSTDSLDAEGRVVDSRPLSPGWSREAALEAALEAERRRTTQLPPQFSAIKLDGRPAYERARRGETTDLKARPVSVRRLEVEFFDDERLDVRLDVSKGYYVRSFARDVSQWLGVPGHLGKLRRTRSGCFSLDESCAWPPPSHPRLLSMADAARRALPHATLTLEGEFRARQGKALGDLHFENLPACLAVDADSNVEFAWLGPCGELVALGQRRDGEYRVRRGFVLPS